MRVKINLNDTVHFKLTEYGKSVLNEYKTKYQLQDSVLDDVDEHGYAHTQLWSFIEVFGPSIHIGFNPVVQGNTLEEWS